MIKKIKKHKKTKSIKRKRELIELDLFFQIWRSEIEQHCDISKIKRSFLYRAYLKKYSIEEIKRRYIKTPIQAIDDIKVDLSLISFL